MRDMDDWLQSQILSARLRIYMMIHMLHVQKFLHTG